MEKKLPEETMVECMHGIWVAKYLHHIATASTEEEAKERLMEKLIKRGVIK